VLSCGRGRLVCGVPALSINTDHGPPPILVSQPAPTAQNTCPPSTCFRHGDTHFIDMESTRVCQRAARKAVQHITFRSYSIVHDVPRTSAAIPHTAPPSPSPRSVFDEAVNASAPRNTWTKDEISEIYKTPLMDLAYAAVSSPVEALYMANRG